MHQFVAIVLVVPRFGGRRVERFVLLLGKITGHVVWTCLVKHPLISINNSKKAMIPLGFDLKTYIMPLNVGIFGIELGCEDNPRNIWKFIQSK